MNILVKRRAGSISWCASALKSVNPSGESCVYFCFICSRQMCEVQNKELKCLEDNWLYFYLLYLCAFNHIQFYGIDLNQQWLHFSIIGVRFSENLWLSISDNMHKKHIILMIASTNVLSFIITLVNSCFGGKQNPLCWNTNFCLINCLKIFFRARNLETLKSLKLN